MSQDFYKHEVEPEYDSDHQEENKQDWMNISIQEVWRSLTALSYPEITSFYAIWNLTRFIRNCKRLGIGPIFRLSGGSFVQVCKHIDDEALFIIQFTSRGSYEEDSILLSGFPHCHEIITYVKNHRDFYTNFRQSDSDFLDRYS